MNNQSPSGKKKGTLTLKQLEELVINLNKKVKQMERKLNEIEYHSTNMNYDIDEAKQMALNAQIMTLK